MSRRRKAIVAAAFSYGQTLVGIAISLYVTRLLVRLLGRDLYGVWLASGALLGYAALADLGIFGVFPWLVAEADGAKDEAKMRSVVAHGVLLGAIGGGLYAVVCFFLWFAFPAVLHLTESDRRLLFGPIVLLAGVTSVSFPLRLFGAVQTGLQDFRYMGVVAIAQTFLGGLTTVILAFMGFGLYAIAVGTALPPLFSSAAGFFRARSQNPNLFAAWPHVTWAETRPLLTSGIGQWLGSFGWQMAFASDAVVIAYLGLRDSVPTFVITSRLGLTLMQFGWTIPDAALVGLAQLNAEGNRERTAEVVSLLVRLHLMIAGAIAIGLLCVNGGFVTSWVGADFFGGLQLSAAFSIDVIFLSLVHALVTPVAVLGLRVRVGVLTMLNGVVHVILALTLGHFWGLRGVAIATALSAVLTTAPAGFHLVTTTTALSRAAFARSLTTWALRLLPFAVIAAFGGRLILAIGALGKHGPLVVGSLLAIILSYAFARSTRLLWADFPFGERLKGMLAKMRLV